MSKFERKIDKKYKHDLEKAENYYNNYDYFKAEPLYRKCYKYFKENGQSTKSYQALEKYIIILMRRGENLKALPKIDEFLKYSTKISNKELIALSLGLKGMICKNQGDFVKSIKLTKSARKLFEEMQNWRDLISCFINLGNSYYYLGDYEKSLKNYNMAESICLRNKIYNIQSKIYQLISFTYLALNNNDKFEEYFSKTMEHFDEIKDPLIKAEILNNISSPAFYSEKLSDEIYNYLKKLLDYYNLQNIFNQKVKTLRNLAGILSIRGEHTAALEYLTEALELSVKYKDHIDKAYTLNNFGLVYFNSENYDLAIQNLTKSIKLAKKYVIIPLIINGYKSLGEIYKILGIYEKSYRNFREALDYYKNISDNISSIEQREQFRECYQDLPKIIKELNSLIESEEIQIKLDDLFSLQNVSKKACQEANNRYPNLINQDCNLIIQEQKTIIEELLQERLETDSRILLGKRNKYNIKGTGFEFQLTSEQIDFLFDKKCLKDKKSKTIEIDIYGSKNKEEEFLFGECTTTSLKKISKKVHCFIQKVNIIAEYHIRHNEKIKKNPPKFHLILISLKNFPPYDVLKKIVQENLKVKPNRIIEIEYIDYDLFYQLLGQYNIKRDKYRLYNS